MRRTWEEIKRDEVKGQWAGLYVTINRKGSIVLSRAAHERLGAPAAFTVLYDAANTTIGLKPTTKQARNAYPARKSGHHGGRRIAAFRLVAEHRLFIEQTLEFPDAEIDTDGILVLNLRTARVSNRALSYLKRPRP